VRRIAQEKIIKFNPQRYYILSYYDVNPDELETINHIIDTVKKEHGCQIVINGIIPTLKYYLRLIENLERFLSLYSALIQEDSELKTRHKQKWNSLILALENDG